MLEIEDYELIGVNDTFNKTELAMGMCPGKYLARDGNTTFSATVSFIRDMLNVNLSTTTFSQLMTGWPVNMSISGESFMFTMDNLTNDENMLYNRTTLFTLPPYIVCDSAIFV